MADIDMMLLDSMARSRPEDILNQMELAVGHRYRPENFIGEGSYGTVITATDRIVGCKVAIKRIIPGECPRTLLRTAREIKILGQMKHENIIDIRDLICAEHFNDLNEIHLVQTLMDSDLRKILRIQRLSADHICFVTYQILRGLKYIHSANILHRDLKPENILINADCSIKICDFGLSRTADIVPNRNDDLTEYVVTRWYRAPELLLSSTHYTSAIDMWSVGCILAEMLNGQPIFPGKYYLDQLNRILNIIGGPSEESIRNAENENAREYLSNLECRPKRQWTSLFPEADKRVLDLLDTMLTFDPTNRITAVSAIGAEYFDIYCDPIDEPNFESGLFSTESETQLSNVDEHRELLWTEILRFHLNKPPENH